MMHNNVLVYTNIVQNITLYIQKRAQPLETGSFQEELRLFLGSYPCSCVFPHKVMGQDIVPPRFEKEEITQGCPIPSLRFTTYVAMCSHSSTQCRHCPLLQVPQRTVLGPTTPCPACRQTMTLQAPETRTSYVTSE